MNNHPLTPCYRVHLVRIDGEPIDTTTGTLAFSHAFTRRNGKAYTPAQVERKYNKNHGSKGYQVDRVEVYYINPNA